MPNRHHRATLSRLLLAGSALVVPMLAQAASPVVSQTPLAVGTGAPGNLALVPSVEWPTINSVANLGEYSSNTVFVGYFDPHKCYRYHYAELESERHFYPSSTSGSRRCPGDGEWSGNYLNWAATQTIDPFRKALTGGLRARDTPGETWLEKARHDGQGGTGLYPHRRAPADEGNNALVRGATAFESVRDCSGWWCTTNNASSIHTRIEGLGTRMWFRINGSKEEDLEGNEADVQPYNPAENVLEDTTYEVSIRVKVCDASVGLEDNCVAYSGGHKPEGLLQESAEDLRVGVFGYLNDSDMQRDGGVLRARMGDISGEWDADTGVMNANPYPADADATSSRFSIDIERSGVMNYLNLFGQLTDHDHKSHDPVSELYYAATRYFRNIGNVDAYSSMSGANRQQRERYADGFPVITDWEDPVAHWCQTNVILGIGDIYTHRDKNLPGNTSFRSDEPSRPPEVADDDFVDVVEATNRVGLLEGLGDIGATNSFTGRNNSAYMAGLAYVMNTRDIRPDLTGESRLSTYWVDVLEAQSLEGMARNPFALAAKYGGFREPPGFGDPLDREEPLPQDWWHRNGETLTPFGPRGSGQPAFPRPDNYFLAGQAAQMVDSLREAFAAIVSESRGTGASLAANSTRLDAGTRIYQAVFTSGSWDGDMLAFGVDPDSGAVDESPAWRASDALPDWEDRNIHTNTGGGNPHRAFEWQRLPQAAQNALGNDEAVLDYLRGDRSLEEPAGPFRARGSALGDIVHSQPVLVGKPNAGLFANASGGDGHAGFAQQHQSRPATIYVGSNAGMLHAFDADTGGERYAFVPRTVIDNGLADLADPDYEHRYFVDGELTVADAYAGGRWRTVLIGTLGRGGPGVFALDVTDPDDIDLLWEHDGSSIGALGRNIGKPIVAQVANGDWRVLIGNGPDNGGTNAQLVTIDVGSGAVSTVGTGTGEALSAVESWDSNGDGFFDTAYAGDLEGNLWRFSDLGGSATAERLFVAQDAGAQAQPITAAPIATSEPGSGRTWVFFGTGRYLHEDDLQDNSVQSWYGLIDDGDFIGHGATARNSALVEREIETEESSNGVRTRSVSEGSAADLAGMQGWFIDLLAPGTGAQGERMIVPNVLRGEALVGTTRIPDSSDICRPTGRGFVMAIDPFTGARLDDGFFILDPDSEDPDPEISGVGFDSSPNQPIFIGDVMQTVLDDTSRESVRVREGVAGSERLSWREIIGD